MEKSYLEALKILKIIIGNEAIVEDNIINDAINNVIKMPFYNNLNRDKLKKELVSFYSTTIGAYKILEKDRRLPWLKEFKAQKKSNWHFWSRYKDYLSNEQNFPPKVIIQLDDLSDKILDKLFNPQLGNIQISKKGLVVGQVQSGKTANYTGLICKAADAGYNFIVVLAGIHNNLRSQTQCRIDEGFLGFSTAYARAFSINKTTKIGVGLISGYDDAIAHSYTTCLETGDFTANSANTAGFNFNAPQPIILIVKKNAAVLNRLYKWLTSQSIDGKISHKSLLVIDDEADNASINTNKEELNPTTINHLICSINNLFNKSAYVGYTATPFANIFIPQNEYDLFPQDFIINIAAPSNYIGPEKVFGTSTNINSVNSDLLPIVNIISDAENFIPQKHKKDEPKPSYDSIPKSLKDAIKCFIITCAIRLARRQEKKHNSMLIHVSRFRNWQDHIKEIVSELFDYYKREIEAGDEAILEEFRCIFEVDSISYKSYKNITKEILNSSLKSIDNNIVIHDWSEIKPLLFPAIQKIEVKSINGTSGDNLTYNENEKNGISVIAIGGDKLSRGLTLEGLSVSYFLRASKMYDTLMQMGRWFGYRPGYVDLCRLFTSTELNEWFRHITLASEELRDEFNYLAESGSTPENYALKIRTHPGSLQITAVNKMRSANFIQVSWAGKLVETYQLAMDLQIKEHNLKITHDLIEQLGTYKTKKSNYLWYNISPDIICDYFLKFKVAPSLKKVNLELIVDYINKVREYGELTSWNIVLMNKIDNPGKIYSFTNTIQTGCYDRNRATDLDWDTYCIRNNHILGNQTDEFIDLDENILNQALLQTRKNNPSWNANFPSPAIVRKEYRPSTTPLLIIYPLNPICANVENTPDGSIIYETKDNPFISFAISFPKSTTDVAISYAANQLEDFSSTEEAFEKENDNIYGN